MFKKSIVLATLLMSLGLSFGAAGSVGRNYATEMSNVKLQFVQTALEAIKKSDIDLNAQDAKGKTLLHFACANLCIEIAHELLLRGADLSVKDSAGNTPINLLFNRADAMKRMFHQRWREDKERCEKFFLQLLESIFPGFKFKSEFAGIDVEPKGVCTPFNLVSPEQIKNRTFVMRWLPQSHDEVAILLQPCIDGCLPSENGDTMLHSIAQNFARGFSPEKESIDWITTYMQVLVAYGVDILVPNSAGKTAEHILKESTYEYFAELGQRSLDDENKKQIDEKLKPFLDIFEQARNCTQTTPSHAASSSTSQSSSKRNLAQEYCEKRETARRDLLLAIQRSQVDLNAQDSQGRTLLHHACANGWSDVVRVLVQRGADLGAKDYSGQEAIVASEDFFLESGEEACNAFFESCKDLIQTYEQQQHELKRKLYQKKLEKINRMYPSPQKSASSTASLTSTLPPISSGAPVSSVNRVSTAASSMPPERVTTSSNHSATASPKLSQKQSSKPATSASSNQTTSSQPSKPSPGVSGSSTTQNQPQNGTSNNASSQPEPRAVTAPLSNVRKAFRATWIAALLGSGAKGCQEFKKIRKTIIEEKMAVAQKDIADQADDETVEPVDSDQVDKPAAPILNMTEIHKLVVQELWKRHKVLVSTFIGSVAGGLADLSMFLMA